MRRKGSLIAIFLLAVITSSGETLANHMIFNLERKEIVIVFLMFLLIDIILFSTMRKILIIGINGEQLAWIICVIDSSLLLESTIAFFLMKRIKIPVEEFLQIKIPSQEIQKIEIPYKEFIETMVPYQDVEEIEIPYQLIMKATLAFVSIFTLLIIRKVIEILEDYEMDRE